MMKKILSLLLVLCLCLSVFPTVALAAEEDDFVIDENGVLTKYTGPGGDVVIPDGVAVIGYKAFEKCKGLTSVTIGNSVTTIGKDAFSFCSGLTSVTIPDSVTRIGQSAFTNCTGLTGVTIPNSVTEVGGSAFSSCTGLTSVTIPSSVKTIDRGTFYKCTSLKSVTIDNGVTEVGWEAFYGCTGLTSVTIGNGVTKIGWNAFKGCTNLTSVTIPDSVTWIDSDAFSGCNNLTSVNVPSSTSMSSSAFPSTTKITRVGEYFDIRNGVLYDYEGPGGDVVIPDSVKTIGENAFKGCTNLTSVTIPDSVTRIDWHAFSGCTNLASITFSGKCDIDFYGNVFEGCINLRNVYVEDMFGISGVFPAITTVTTLSGIDITGLNISSDGTLTYYGRPGTDVVIPDGITAIGNAFSGRSDITSVTIPDSVTEIGQRAFSGCTGLTGVTIPGSVTYIGNFAFSGCTGLTSVSVPNSVKTIGGEAFANCTGLTGITIPDSVKTIGERAFEGCAGLTSVTIPKSVTEIGREAFKNCTNLTSVTVPSTTQVGTDAFPSTTEVLRTGHNFTVEKGVLKAYVGPGGDITIPGNVTAIDSRAFAGHAEITAVTIPGSVVTIGYEAFSGCTGLKSVTIQEGVKSIGNSAFSSCTSLTSVDLPEGITSFGSGVFSGCVSLTSIAKPASLSLPSNAVPSWTKITLKGHSFNIQNGVLKRYEGAGGNVVIPDSVTKIGDAAFADCTGLTGVTIPSSVTSIGGNAFAGCTGLKSITIPGSVTSIGGGAFAGCTNLASATVPNSTNMSSSAFPSTTKVTRTGEYLNIQNGVLMGYRGSGGNVVIPNSVTSIGSSAFSGCTNLTGVTIPSSVTSIGGNAFSGCTGLTSVTIPNSVTEIGYNAFSRCTGLTSVSVPNSVKTIGGEAFANCTGLTSVTLGSGLTSLGSDAFANCAGLTSITIPGSLTKLNGGTFEGCTGLTGITVQPGVKEVTLHYGDCPNLKRISLPDSVEKLSVSSNSLREIAIPAGVTSWPTLNCPRLTKLTFPTDNWVFKGISRADFMKNIKNYTALNEVVNCPNEFVDDLIAPNKAIQNNWKNPKSTVVSQSARIASLSNEITAGCATEYDKAKAISQWVVDHIKYDDDYYYAGLKNYSDVPFDAAEVLEKGQAVCAGYARLTQALLVAQGIPCLYVLGWVSDGYHAWNLAYVDGEYIWIDNTWGMKYFGLGVYAISRDHTATGAATFNDVKGPGTLVPGVDSADGVNAEKSTIGTALPETAEDILVREKIEELKSRYPDGMSWNDGNTYYSEGLGATGSGCVGFAYLCSDAAFGKVPASEAGSSFNKVRVGDILRINGDTHSVVVLRKMSDGVIVAEGNYNGMIRWGREISKAELEQGGLKITTRWGAETSQDATETTAKGLPADMGTAYPSTQAVNVDGTPVSFQCYALKDANGFDTNYIKLRDLADILNGTAAQFQVGWDGSITITTGQGYTKNGSEQNTPFSGERNYTRAFAPTYINGERASLAAFLLNDDAGGGYTYFQLRDLGKALNFNVGWSAERGIYLETNKPYDPNN